MKRGREQSLDSAFRSLEEEESEWMEDGNSLDLDGDGDGDGDGDEDGEGDESFANSFYKGGTDWTSLEKKKDKKKLVQTSLSSLWNLKLKTPPNSSNAGEPCSTNKNVASQPPRAQGNIKLCPFYKKIPGTTFVVDAFRYGSINGCTAYFLTHFHFDHYGGLTKAWSHGPIYCSPATARLVTLCLSVDLKHIHTLELNKIYIIDGTKVQLMDANHCPGAVLIHFELQSGEHILHTGDFRAIKEMQCYPCLKATRIDKLFLDTTYCNPKYRFPPQKDVIDYVVKITKTTLSKNSKTLIVVGAYSIGKERVFLGIAEAMKVQIYTDSRRKQILSSLQWPELSERLCSNATSTFLHVLPISMLHIEKLKNYLGKFQSQFSSILAFRPTGWTYSNKIGNQLDLLKPISKSNITIYGVPYSEHSSFIELKEFVQFLRPKKIIPTVNNGNPTIRATMQSHFQEWLS